MIFKITSLLASWFLSIFLFLIFLSESVYAAPAISGIVDNVSNYSNSSVPKYSKLEITFQIAGISASNLHWPYLAAGESDIYLGKYVDQGITVDLELSPDNWITVYRQPAFYFQNFEVGSSRLSLYPLDQFSWKARFSPHKAGSWQYRIRAKDKGGESVSDPKSFAVVESSSKGFVKVSSSDNRYFEFDNGTYFPGLGINTAMGDLHDESYVQALSQNRIQLIRAWLAPMNIYGSSWTAWELMPGKYDGYLPRTPILPAEDYPGGPKHFYWYLSQTSSWYEQCAFLGHTQHKPTIKPNTNYFVRARYRTNNLTGPRDGRFNNYGLVFKVGGWQGNCEDPYEPGIDPGYFATQNITNYGQNSQWDEVKGVWNSGNNTELPFFFMALENASTGVVFVDKVEMIEMTGGSVDQPILKGANIIDKHSADGLSYYNQKAAFIMDKVIDNLSKYDVYVKPVLFEVNDYLSGKIDAYGNPTDVDSVDQFYGAPNNCTNCRDNNAQRWLQDAFMRYAQGRWGYSPNIHSWELINEGNPWHTGHYARTDEMGKTLKCRVFGISIGYLDGQPCTYDHPNSHMVSTSFWHSFPVEQFWKSNNYPNVDYADIHAYISTSNGIDYSLPGCSKTEMSYDAAAYHECHSRQYTGWKLGKPLIRGEAGLDSPTSQNSDILNIQRDTKGVWLHNYIWAGLSSGGMLEQYWWIFQHITYTYDGASVDNRKEYRNYYQFVENIPLNKGGYADSAAVTTNTALRVWGQKNSSKSLAHLWIQNKGHTWKNVVDGANIVPQSGSVTIPGMAASTPLRVEWWDTYTGTVNRSETVSTDSQGNLVINIENLTSDTAVKIGNYSDSTPNVKPGDADGDGDVDIYDYNIVISDFGTNSSRSDFNKNGRVDIYDYNTLISNFGR